MIICSNNQDFIKLKMEKIERKHNLEAELRSANIELRVYFSPSHIENISKDVKEKNNNFEKLTIENK